MNRKIQTNSGFSVIWISVLMVLITTTITISLTTDLIFIENKYRKTQKNMLEIKKAMAAYVLQNWRLPCPAALSLSYDDTSQSITTTNYGTIVVDYGEELVDGISGECITDLNTGTIASSNVVVGAIPSKALNIPDKYTVDGWDNKLTYAVNILYTIPYTIDTNVSGWLDGIPALITIDSGSTTIENNSMFVLVSHGPNGLGAFGRFAISQNNLPTDIYEIQNVYNSSGITDVFNTNAADDLILYHDPHQQEDLINKFDTQNE